MYEVKIDGASVVCHTCRVSAQPFNRPWPGKQRPKDQTEEAEFVCFDMKSPVSVTVRTDKKCNDVVVRPLSKKINPVCGENEVSFTVSEPGQYSLEINGRHGNLHIFANPIDNYEKDENTIYFGAGYHAAGDIELHDNQTLFIDSGAVVSARVHSSDSSNVKIVGHGILDCSEYERHDPVEWERDGLLNFIRCKNVTVDGVVLRDSDWWTASFFNCDGVTLSNVKTIGMWRYNTDGFDFVNSKDVTVRGCFLRNFDDAVVLKGLREYNFVNGERVLLKYDYMNVENYLIENCVIWCDWGGALEIGAETLADEYRNITFRSCDIICNTSGAMRIHSGDRATVHDVLYENISVEYTEYDLPPVIQKSDGMTYEPENLPYIPFLIMGWMYCGKWSDDMILGNVYDITYRNINVFAPRGSSLPPIAFAGADSAHTFDNITIDGLYFNGKRVCDKSEIEFRNNRFAGNIELK